MSQSRQPKKGETVEPNGNGGKELITVEKQIERLNPTLLEGLPKGKKDQILSLFVLSKSHKGPLPPPEDLEHYGQIIPNGAERIMSMAENQQKHRIQLEDHAVKEELFQSRLGQIFAFVIALVCIGVGAYLSMNGLPKVGGLLVGSTLVSLVSIFVAGKYFQKQDLRDKK